MSTTNGPPGSSKRRKVSTTESTTSSRSSITNNTTATDQISPSRASRRIAGKERSYSHKFGYGEDEAILFIDDEKRKGSSPKKSVATTVVNDFKKEKDNTSTPANSDAVAPPKRKYQRKQSNATDEEPKNTKNEQITNSNHTSARPKRNRTSNEAEEALAAGSKPEALKVERRQSVEPKKRDRKTSKDEQLEPSGLRISARRRSSATSSKASMEVQPDDDNTRSENDIESGNEFEEDTVEEKVEKGKCDEVQGAEVVNLDVKLTNSTSPAPPPPPQTEEDKQPRKYTRRAKTENNDEPAPPVMERRTRQTVQNESTPSKPTRKIESSVKVNGQTNSTNSTTTTSTVAKTANRNATTSKAQTLTSTKVAEYPNATKHLVDELKASKKDQATVLEEFRKNQTEQQQVINDLRKHRDLQEKLIEDLRQSRNEKQAEIDKLHAQQRASTILFQRDGDAQLSRYLSDDESGMDDDTNDVDDTDDVSTGSEGKSKNPLEMEDTLNKIMAFVPTADLPNCRLVNRLWCKHASNQFKKIGCINLRFGVTDFMNAIQPSSSIFPATNFIFYFNEIDPNTDNFLTRYGNSITRLQLILDYFYAEQFSFETIAQFLPANLPNLKHLSLELPCTFLSRPEEIQLFTSATKLETLEVVCQCSVMIHDDTDPPAQHFKYGLLSELLKNSPELHSFSFESGQMTTNSDLARRVVLLLNRMNLTKLKHLTLCGQVIQDLRGELPNYQLSSISLDGLKADEAAAIWAQNIGTLERLTVGKMIENSQMLMFMLQGKIFSSVKELAAHSQINSVMAFSKLFPNLRSLELHNPTESCIVNIFEYMTGLQELIINFSDDAEDDKYKVLHLDSLLSGFSINNCELILKKLIKKGLPRSLGLDEKMEIFGELKSIHNMKNLQKLVITSSANSIALRITELGLAMVLLKMKSLTSITINPCFIRKETLKELMGRISPAIHLNIQCPEKGNDYDSAKLALMQ